MPDGYTVKTSGTPTARADYACLGKKCKTEHGATVYELPVGAICCPACGSKRIQRIYTAPNISKNIARRTDAMLEPTYTKQAKERDAGAFARKFPTWAAEKHQAPAFGMPLHGGIQGAISEAFRRSPQFRDTPVPGWAPDPIGQRVPGTMANPGFGNRPQGQSRPTLGIRETSGTPLAELKQQGMVKMPKAAIPYKWTPNEQDRKKAEG